MSSGTPLQLNSAAGRQQQQQQMPSAPVHSSSARHLPGVVPQGSNYAMQQQVQMAPSHQHQHQQHHQAQPLLMASVQPSAPSASVVVADSVEDHILRPNCFSASELVARVSAGGAADSGDVCNLLCCSVFGLCGILPLMCGRVFRTGIGQVDLWLDSNKHPLALEPNTWQLLPNWMQERLGAYDMSSAEPFSSNGVCIAKIEAGSVYFAHQGGQPVMIAAKERPGWFVSTDAGFSFARDIVVDGQWRKGCCAKLNSSYLSFESLHLFNVQPNTVHVVSNYVPGMGNQWQVLPPGSHSFSSPFMRSMALINTSIQDVIITEPNVSTQDGIQLTKCHAVLSYQIRPENVPKLLILDVQNYMRVIEDWAKRTMLHEISCMEYQSHNPVIKGGEPGDSTSQQQAKPSSILGGRDAKNFSAAAGSSSMSADGQVMAHVAEGASSASENAGFRPTLEHHMQRALELSLNPYGVEIKTFALQSFDPPPALAAQLTTALARRTEAKYAYEAQQIINQTMLGQAETEATAIRTRAAAVARAAELTASVPHARALQILDKQVEIARAWSNGRATTLVLQGGIGGMGGDMGPGPRDANMGSSSSAPLPFASISEMAKAGQQQEQGGQNAQ